jgi:hypothetical protein
VNQGDAAISARPAPTPACAGPVRFVRRNLIQAATGSDPRKLIPLSLADRHPDPADGTNDPADHPRIAVRHRATGVSDQPAQPQSP